MTRTPHPKPQHHKLPSFSPPFFAPFCSPFLSLRPPRLTVPVHYLLPPLPTPSFSFHAPSPLLLPTFLPLPTLAPISSPPPHSIPLSSFPFLNLSRPLFSCPVRSHLPGSPFFSLGSTCFPPFCIHPLSSFHPAFLCSLFPHFTRQYLSPFPFPPLIFSPLLPTFVFFLLFRSYSPLSPYPSFTPPLLFIYCPGSLLFLILQPPLFSPDIGFPLFLIFLSLSFFRLASRPTTSVSVLFLASIVLCYLAFTWSIASAPVFRGLLLWCCSWFVKKPHPPNPSNPPPHPPNNHTPPHTPPPPPTTPPPQPQTQHPPPPPPPPPPPKTPPPNPHHPPTPPHNPTPTNPPPPPFSVFGLFLLGWFVVLGWWFFFCSFFFGFCFFFVFCGVFFFFFPGFQEEY